MDREASGAGDEAEAIAGNTAAVGCASLAGGVRSRPTTHGGTLPVCPWRNAWPGTMARAGLIGILLLGVASGCVRSAHAAVITAAGDPVLYWNDVLLDAVRAAGPPPPVAARSMALVGVAVHDAVNTAAGAGRGNYLGGIDLPAGDVRAAASVAARDVLVSLYPSQTPTFDAALAASLALVLDGPAKARGLSLGAATAAASLALRGNDGSDAVVVRTPGGQPGHWQLTPPAFAEPLLPQWPGVDPWVMASGSVYRPPAPPALGSDAYAAAYNEVKSLGAAGSAARTAEQTDIALYWADGAGTATPPGHWLSIASDVSVARGLSMVENANLFGLLALSMADTAITAWDAKYTYDLWRPVTAIQRGDEDGNALTEADPTWSPLLVTPPFPSYVSGHSAFSAAAGRILTLSLGDDAEFCSAQDSGEAPPIGAGRCWSSFSQAAAEAGRSRIYGGIHWSFDDEWGRMTGIAVADRAYATLFQPVPEPNPLGLLGASIALLLLARSALGRGLGLWTVAEDIESEAQCCLRGRMRIRVELITSPSRPVSKACPGRSAFLDSQIGPVCH